MSVNAYLVGSPADKKFQEYSRALHRRRLRPGQKSFTQKQQDNLVELYSVSVAGGAKEGYLDRISGLESFTMLDEAFGRKTYELFFPNPEHSNDAHTWTEIDPAAFIETGRKLANEWDSLRRKDEESIRAQLFNNQVSGYLSQLIAFGFLAQKLNRRRKTARVVLC